MTQNEVDIIKNAVLDATEAYVDVRLATAAFVKTQIGVVVSAYENTAKKWVHTVRCNSTPSNPSGITYNNVLSVNNIHFENNSVVFILAPNAQYSNQFILGKLDNVPYDIVGGSINIGNGQFIVKRDGDVFCNGDITCHNLIANNEGEIGSFKITSSSLGDPTGTTNAVGMSSKSHVYAWNPSYWIRMYPNELQMNNSRINLYYGSSWCHITSQNIESNDKGYVRWQVDTSDRRCKNNIKEISPNKIKKFFNKIKPSMFKFNKDIEDKDDLVHYGVIAQNLEESLKEANIDSSSLVKKNNTKDILLVDYQELHGLELAGIKDLYNIIQNQQEQINELKNKIKSLEKERG